MCGIFYYENRLTKYWNNEINKDKQRRLEGYHARKKYFDKLIGHVRQYKMIFIGNYENKQNMKFGKKLQELPR